MRKSLPKRTSCAAINMLKISIIWGQKLVIYSTGTMKKQMLCSFGLAVPHTSVWWTESNRRQRTVLSSKTSLLVQGACLCGLCFTVLPPVPWPQHPRVGAGGRGVTVCVTMAASLTPPCCDAAVGTFLLSCPILQHYH